MTEEEIREDAHQFVPLDHATRNKVTVDRYIAQARAALRHRAVRPDTEEHHHDPA